MELIKVASFAILSWAFGVALGSDVKCINDHGEQFFSFPPLWTSISCKEGCVKAQITGCRKCCVQTDRTGASGQKTNKEVINSPKIGNPPPDRIAIALWIVVPGVFAAICAIFIYLYYKKRVANLEQPPITIEPEIPLSVEVVDD